jgi:hypothetical protein
MQVVSPPLALQALSILVAHAGTCNCSLVIMNTWYLYAMVTYQAMLKVSYIMLGQTVIRET